jgi:hypothetical protein
MHNAPFIPEGLAKELRDYVKDIRGHLFASAQGEPLQNHRPWSRTKHEPIDLVSLNSFFQRIFEVG